MVGLAIQSAAPHNAVPISVEMHGQYRWTLGIYTAFSVALPSTVAGDNGLPVCPGTFRFDPLLPVSGTGQGASS